MTLYKIVRTNTGLTVAHVSTPDDARVVEPDGREGQVRADRLYVEFIENYEGMAWGPVDGRTTYHVGRVTESHDLCTDEGVVSGAGLHAFREREDAVQWKENADV